MPRRGLAVLGALAFAMAACSSDDDASDATAVSGATVAEEDGEPGQATISTGTVAEGLEAFCDAELSAEVAAADDDDAAAPGGVRRGWWPRPRATSRTPWPSS